MAVTVVVEVVNTLLGIGGGSVAIVMEATVGELGELGADIATGIPIEVEKTEGGGSCDDLEVDAPPV